MGKRGGKKGVLTKIKEKRFRSPIPKKKEKTETRRRADRWKELNRKGGKKGETGTSHTSFS